MVNQNHFIIFTDKESILLFIFDKENIVESKNVTLENSEIQRNVGMYINYIY